MKIITCASYYGSGSSALTDLVSEYSSVQENSEFEFRFIHDPDGVSDLEYHLVENHNRECSGYALKRFIKVSDFNSGTWFNKKYEAYFHGKYKEYTKQYVNDLLDFSYKGFWVYDVAAKGKFRYYLRGIINKFFIKLNVSKPQILPKEITYCSHPSEEKFIECTQRYTSNLMEYLNKDNKPFLVVDQILPSSNVKRCMRYFKDEIFVVIFDRDPRDLYILSHVAWNWDHIYPHDSIETWCKWFEYTRKSATEKYDDPHVLYMRFEDMIYNYDESVKKIEEFTGLDPKDHDKPFTRLNPKKSVINTQLWKRYPKHEKEVKYIEEHLSQYLYDYSKVADKEIKGVEVNNKKVF